MAGMIQEQTKQQINGMPGLMQLPVLGALFKSRDYINRQTELMVIVTPYVVRAVAQKDLSRPDDGFADATDPATVLLGRLNRIYGVPGRSSRKRRRITATTASFSTDRRARRRSMYAIQRSRAAMARASRIALRAVAVAGAAPPCSPAATAHDADRQRSSRTTIASAIRSRIKEGARTRRAVHRHQPRRPDAGAARRGAGLRAGLEARSDRRHHHRRADRHAATSAPPPTRCAKSARSWPPPACRRTAIGVRPYQPADPRKLATLRLNYPTIDRGGRPVRAVAARSRADLRPRALSRTSRTGISAAPPSATSPPWSTTRPTSCSRAAKTPAYTPRRTVGARQVSPGREPGDDLSRTPNKGKISDVGK